MHSSHDRHPEVRALRCTCTAGRARRMSGPGQHPSRRPLRGLLRMTGMVCCIAARAMCGAWLAPASAAPLPRIVSMNVCTDQGLLALADPGQILGLSRFSRDAWVAGDIRRYPRLSGGAEDVLVLKP